MALAIRRLAFFALCGALVLDASRPARPVLLNHPRVLHALPQSSRRVRSATRTMDPQDIQHEVEDMVSRVKELHDENMTVEFAQELEGVEEAIAVRVGNGTQLSAEILQARADLCTQQGFKAHETISCEAFMKAACQPDAPSPQVPATFCETFFGSAALKLNGLRGAPNITTAAASTPVPATAPGYFGGKHIGWLPEQGVTGKLIRHRDFETMSEDWMAESKGDAREICKKHPNNEWCQLHFASVPSSLEAEAEDEAADVSKDDGQPMDQRTLRTENGSRIKSTWGFPSPFKASSTKSGAIGALVALFLNHVFL